MRKIKRGGSRDGNTAGASVLPRQPSSPLQTTPAQFLTGTYTDEAVEDMAAEDGRADLFTATWGQFNREPRVIHTVNQSAKTADDLISHQAEEALVETESELEQLAPEIPLAEDRVLDAISSIETTSDEVTAVRERCRGGDFPIPEQHWRRMLAEVGGFALLGTGDLYFVSTTFQVFGLSDAKLVSFLPFNQLQLVGSSVVVALLLLTRLAGHKIRKIGQLVEEIKAAEADNSPDAGRLSRLVVRTQVLIGVAATSILGIFLTLCGLSLVRASFLKQEGINAHQTYYLMIQAGIAFAGLVLAFWMSHPLDVDWRSACHHDRVAVAALKGSYANLVEVVARFNALLRLREAQLIQFRDWSNATTSDAIRKSHLIARRLQLSLPEPIEEKLLPDQLPMPLAPALAQAVTNYLDGKGSYFKQYTSLTMDRIDKRLQELDDRRTGQRVDNHNHLIDVLSKTREPAMAGTRTNGKGKTP